MKVEINLTEKEQDALNFVLTLITAAIDSPNNNNPSERKNRKRLQIAEDLIHSFGYTSAKFGHPKVKRVMK